MIIDFENPRSVNDWKAVNDGVMGGRSRGGPSFENGYMVFEGRINTDGGGFSSVRTDIDRGSLESSSGLKLRVRGPMGRGLQSHAQDRCALPQPAYRVSGRDPANNG